MYGLPTNDCVVSLILVCILMFYIVFVCHQNVCEDSIGSVYVCGHCGLSKGRTLCLR